MKQHRLSSAIAIAALFCCVHSKTFAQTDWHITGNSGTNASTNFIGTTDNIPLAFRTNNAVRMRINSNGNIGIGTTSPLQKLDVNGNINIRSGFGLFIDNHKVVRIDSILANTFLGVGSGSNNVGVFNTGSGYQSLFSNTSGNYNTGSGYQSLFSNSTGGFNTSAGFQSLYFNTSGDANTANGSYALFANTTGAANTATGYGALYFNSTGVYNSAHGWGALFYNTTGTYNTASGYQALYSNGTGSINTAYGSQALYGNTIGNYNTAIGNGALYYNVSGYFNTAVGFSALYNTTASWSNTALGDRAGATYNNGWNNTFIGAGADAVNPDIYNSIALGNFSNVYAPNQVRVGNSSTTSIGGFANWTNVSDGRVKKNIKENVPGLAFINKLKAVTYNLDLEAADKITQPPPRKDKEGKIIAPAQVEINARKAKEQIIYTGFVAQDVEKAAKELNYDFSGVDAAKNSKDLYGLRYSDFVVPLVKAVQELSKQNDELKQRIEKLEAATTAQTESANTTSQGVTISTASLEQNTPNPFKNVTIINYTLPQQYASAKVMITDKSGKIIKEINVTGTGKGSVQVDASTLASGAYQYSLLINGKLIGTKQMVLAR